MRTQQLFLWMGLLFLSAVHLYAYEERNLLQKIADLEEVKSASLPSLY